MNSKLVGSSSKKKMTTTIKITCLLGAIASLLIVGGMAMHNNQSEFGATTESAEFDEADSVSQHAPYASQMIVDQSSQTELKRLKKQLKSEQRRVNQLRTEVARLSIQSLDGDDDIDGSLEEDLPPMLASGETEDQVRANESMVILDDALRNETPDPQWSAMATGSIHEILDSEAFSSSELIDVSCAATLCRLETRQQDMEMTDQFLDQFAFQIDWSDSAFAKVIDHQDGGQTIVYYMSREGYDLPGAES